jgi:excisionase family DNA binding protein
MLTPKQAAQRLGESVSWIYQLCQQAVLRHYRVGGAGRRGRIVIDEKDFANYQASCCKEAAQAPLHLKHLQLG